MGAYRRNSFLSSTNKKYNCKINKFTTLQLKNYDLIQCKFISLHHAHIKKLKCETLKIFFSPSIEKIKIKNKKD